MIGRLLVLIGGLLGAAAFFLPFVVVPHQGREISISAFQAVRGVAAIEAAVEATAGASAPPSPALRRTRVELARTLDGMQPFLFAVYAPAGALVLVGLLGALRRTFGRMLGALALVLGLVEAAVWFLIAQVTLDAPVSFGLGVHLLAAAGAAAAAGGLLALSGSDLG